ncbi:MAG: universal stress protein [Planctomycetaceae bacterium]|nr:MAG: universal stress protein [Planctomycetaceae bacterium]
MNKWNKIIYPTDFSSAAEAVFDTAQRLARDSDALLLIVHVVEPVVAATPGTVAPPVTIGGTDLSETQQKAVTEARKELHKVVPTDPVIRFEHRVIEGLASDGILNLAELEQPDLIVMGTHGRTGLKRLLMGSVAEKIVRHARCPVLTLKASKSSSENSGESEAPRS